MAGKAREGRGEGVAKAASASPGFAARSCPALVPRSAAQLGALKAWAVLKPTVP